MQPPESCQSQEAPALADLGSDATLRALVGSMLTAGLTQGVLNVAQIDAVTPGATLRQNFANAAQRNLIKAAIKIGVQTTVEGQPLDQSLISALRLAAADTLGTSVATEIGKAVHGGEIDTAAQLIAHAALGCATGTISAGDCAGGAVGAVSGEITAGLYFSEQQQQAFGEELANAISDGSLTKDKADALIKDWRNRGISIASLAGGLAAAMAGGTVDAGASAAGTAVENNFCGTGLCVAVVVLVLAALEVTDKVLIAKDAYDIADASLACNAGSQSSCDQALELAKQAAVDAGIELTIGAVIPGSKAAADLLRWARHNADADTMRALTALRML